VVDDNVDAADTLTELLRLSNHIVESAYEGESALQRAEKLRPDVAFIDLNMPGMDGYALATQIRAAAWGRTMKLVAVTGMGQKADIARTREAGFDEHLTKPADPERLARVASGTDRDENVVGLRARS
jgi:CheY-like chemotaxis protein